MSRPMTMKELREAMENKNQSGGSGRYLPLGQIPVDGQVEVRFIADADKTNPVAFYRDVYKHVMWINGRREDIICPRTIGDNNCPICAASRSFYDSGDEESGKKYWARRSQLFQLIVRNATYDVSELQNKVLLLDAGSQINTKIKAGCDHDLEYVPFDYEMGTDFIIRKTKQGENNNYTTSGFARRESSLSDAEIQIAEEGAIDLRTAFESRIKSHAELEAIIESDLTGSSFVDKSGGVQNEQSTMRERFQRRLSGEETSQTSPAARQDYDEDLPDREVEVKESVETTPKTSGIEIADILARVRNQ